MSYLISNKQQSACLICSNPKTVFLVRVPDIFGDLYTYPLDGTYRKLPAARVCPLCGKALRRVKER